jgi:hypothetical protein
LPLVDGGETAYRVVVRADSLPGLTDEGRQALVDYGVSLVVDLRSGYDSDGLPEEMPVAVLKTPMDPRVVEAVWNWRSMREAYFALADHYRGQFAQALTLLGDAKPPAAIHCAGGRDRTGIACGMAQWLAGVEPEAIVVDHSLSDESWAPHHPAWFDDAADEQERERRQRVAVPAGRTLIEVLEEIEQREGIRNLLVGAGADGAALDRLVARLRGEL